MTETLIPDRLIKIRKKNSLNKSQAASLLGLSPIGYLRYEQGLRSPSLQMLQLISLKFNVSVDYLVGKTDDSSADKILVEKDANPALFELVCELSDNSDAAAKRLLAYLKQINKTII